MSRYLRRRVSPAVGETTPDVYLRRSGRLVLRDSCAMQQMPDFGGTVNAATSQSKGDETRSKTSTSAAPIKAITRKTWGASIATRIAAKVAK